MNVWAGPFIRRILQVAETFNKRAGRFFILKIELSGQIYREVTLYLRRTYSEVKYDRALITCILSSR